MIIKVGDKVRVHGRGYASKDWVGTEGVVTSLEGSPWGNTIKVKLTKATSEKVSEGHVANLLRDNLDVIPEFRFTDIQQGDLIRRTYTRTDGSKVIWEGAAFRLNYDDTMWLSEDAYQLAYAADDTHTDVDLELLERPKPKHWAYTKPVGATALDKRHSTIPNTLRKTGENEWEQRFLLTGEAYLKTTASLANDLRNLDSEDLEWLK